ncbi:DUF3870 domain-containing protein [Paenibacillus abyssi]|uniref:DUF3870 domain-containing protein n=1 Tax=Paenibacillus abyssi TaxID=1340531 RepID=A0A917D0H7_9BACL|nr:DUF3870 domain-containing protein [Paenibacillus abyssi]GGG02051.1 hypothetical protein GCM10010916_19000 [Paenibacillus abyssi]
MSGLINDISVNHNINLFENNIADYSNISNTAMFTGNARLPSGNALYEMLKVISCVIIVDLKTSTIIDASFTTLSPTANNYIRSLVIGFCLNDGFQVLAKRFDRHLHLTSKKSFIKSLEIAYQRYQDYLTEGKMKIGS